MKPNTLISPTPFEHNPKQQTNVQLAHNPIKKHIRICMGDAMCNIPVLIKYKRIPMFPSIVHGLGKK